MLQVYNIIIWHLYTLQNDHHQKFSYHPSLIQLATFTHFAHHQYFSLLVTVYLWLCFHIISLVSLDSTYEWNHTVFVFLFYLFYLAQHPRGHDIMWLKAPSLKSPNQKNRLVFLGWLAPILKLSWGCQELSSQHKLSGTTMNSQDAPSLKKSQGFRDKDQSNSLLVNICHFWFVRGALRTVLRKILRKDSGSVEENVMVDGGGGSTHVPLWHPCTS